MQFHPKFIVLVNIFAILIINLTNQELLTTKSIVVDLVVGNS